MDPAKNPSTAQGFVNQMLPYSGGNTSPAAQFVANMLPYSSGGPLEPGSPSNPNPTPATDPYAKWGGQGAYNSLVSGFDTQKSNIYGTSRESAQNAAIGRQSSILDFIQGLQSGQRTINERAIQNELGRKQGYNSIMDMVGRGIRSGGTMLANRNAGSSSATEALARAYGDIGRRQLSGIGNQYELENRNINLAQEDFNTQRGTGLRKFEESKQQTVNSIVIDARNRLAQLDAAMAEADLPTRIQIEQEKEAIRGEVQGILSQYDQQLTQGAQGVQASSLEDRRREAFGLANAGVAATNPFDFTAQAPAQFQNTGPNPGQLPIFTIPYRRQEV